MCNPCMIPRTLHPIVERAAQAMPAVVVTGPRQSGKTTLCRAAWWGGAIYLDGDAPTMHSPCMATKTISLRVDAYERLRRARLHPGESFTEVVLRAHWPDRGMTAGELRETYLREGPVLSEEALDRIEEANARDEPPRDKWTEA